MNIHKVDFVNCCDMAHIGSTRCDLSTALLADSPAREYTDVVYTCNSLDNSDVFTEIVQTPSPTQLNSCW